MTLYIEGAGVPWERRRQPGKRLEAGGERGGKGLLQVSFSLLARAEICHILVGFAAEYLWCLKRLVLSGVLVVSGEESLRKLTRFEKTVHNRRLR